MELNHKVQKQRNFIPGESIPDKVEVNRPVVLQRKTFHQQLGIDSAASGLREVRSYNE